MSGVPACRAPSRRTPWRRSVLRAVIETYRPECHDDDKQKGDLTLETFDPLKPEPRPDVAEKMIRAARRDDAAARRDRPGDGSPTLAA
jgi:hypothetical protein